LLRCRVASVGRFSGAAEQATRTPRQPSLVRLLEQ